MNFFENTKQTRTKNKIRDEATTAAMFARLMDDNGLD